MTLPHRIEAAEGADRALDAEIAVKARTGLPNGCEWALKFPNWEAEHNGQVRIIGNVNGNGDYIAGRFTSPKFTASIDAALTLVPEGWGYTLVVVPGSHIEAAVREWQKQDDGRYWTGKNMAQSGMVKAATPALALCSAALRAKEISDGE